MEQSKRKIPLYDYENIAEEDITYRLYGEVDHYGIGGQGDIEYHWVFFCLNKDDKPVLVEEIHDLSWWTGGGPSPSNISSLNLCEITEELLSDEEAEPYFQRFKDQPVRTIALPIEMHLQHKVYDPEKEQAELKASNEAREAKRKEEAQAASKNNKGLLKRLFRSVKGGKS